MPRRLYIRIRRGTTASWLTNNEVLADGEITYDETVEAFKVGDGVRQWSALSYAVGGLLGGTTVNWADITGKPLTFPPDAHSHPESDIVGLTTDLAGKADVVHTHTSTDITDATSVGKAVLTASDAPTARAAIGAGTSSLALGTTSSTALAGNTTAAAIGGVPATRQVAGHALSADVTLTKSDVGLSNVDNTSDVNKPVSTATQTALNGKQDIDSDLTAIAGLTPTNDDLLQRKAGAWTNRTPAQVKTDLALTKSDVGLSNVDNTSDVNKPISTATQTALNGKEPTVASGLSTQYYRGDKTWATLDKAAVGLSNVDNTSDVNKPISTATQTALNGKQDSSAKGVANGYASLDGAGKVPISQLPSSLMTYEGVWNATTNTPTLADGTGDTGQVYRVTVAGTQNLGSGAITFDVGDYAIYNSSGVWEKSDTTDAVASVNGHTGVVTLTSADTGSVPTTRTVAGLDLSADRTAAALKTALGITESDVSGLTSDLAAKVPTSRTLAGLDLSADRTAAALKTALAITEGDVSGLTADLAAKVPTSRTLAGLDLSADRTAAALKSALAITEGDVASLTSDLAAKAPLASPAFTGAPTAPTATAGTNTTQLATTAFVATAVSGAATIRAGTTATAAATAAKTATISGYTPAAGDRLDLTLTLGNTVSSPTLSINGGGATPIFIAGAAADVAQVTSGANSVWALKYDGTNWNLIGPQSNFTAATTSQMQAGTSTALAWMSPALVAAAVKQLGAIVPANAQTANYTLALTDIGSKIKMTSASALTLTVPTNASVAIPVGTTIPVLQGGAGQVTFAPAGGVTIRTASSLTLRAQYSEALLWYEGSDVWYLSGDLT